MQSSVACFAQVILNAIALDLGADLQVFTSMINRNSFITEVFKHDLAVFEVR